MAQQHRPAAVFSDSYVPDWSFALIEWDNPPGPKKRPDGTIRSVNRVNRSTVARWAEKRKVWERKPLVLPRPGSETVIMCLAWGYPIATFRRFVGSLRAHYRGDVAMLLAGQPPPEIHEYLVANRVTQVPVAPIPDHALHRFSDFARVCSAYLRCISVDFRDVFFQADPWAAKGAGVKADADLVFQLEELQIRDCPHNSVWIKQGWGMQALDEFGHKHILCSGIVVGSPRGFEAMAARLPRARPEFEHSNSSGNCGMTTESLRPKTSAEKGGCSRRNRLYGPFWDQPTLMYLAYHQRAAAFRGLSIAFQRRGRGVANTIGAFSGKWSRRDPRGIIGRQDGGKLFPDLDVPHLLARHMDSRGLVLNSDGTPSAIVHQYDRILIPYNAAYNVRFAALAAAE